MGKTVTLVCYRNTVPKLQAAHSDQQLQISVLAILIVQPMMRGRSINTEQHGVNKGLAFSETNNILKTNHEGHRITQALNSMLGRLTGYVHNSLRA